MVPRRRWTMIAGVLEGDQRVRKPRACFHAERRKVVIIEDVFDVFFLIACVLAYFGSDARTRTTEGWVGTAHARCSEGAMCFCRTTRWKHYDVCR